MNNILTSFPKPYDYKFYLCERNKAIIRELPEIKDKNLILQLNGINEVSFTIPYYIHKLSPATKTVERVINPNFMDVKAELLILVQKRPVGEDLLLGEEFFYIDEANTITTEEGENRKEVTAYSLPYKIKYKNLVHYEGVSSIEEVFSRTIGRKTQWKVGHVDESLRKSGDSTKRRFFDVNDINLLDFLFQIVETFDAIPVWNTRDYTVSFYSYENSGRQTDLEISDEIYLKSLEANANYDSLVTRMYCYGNDDLNFRNLSPTGVDYVEDFSYYMYPFKMAANGTVLQSSKHGMSDELCKAIELYKEDVESVEGAFTDLLKDQERAQRKLTDLENGLDEINTQYDIYSDQLDIANATNQDGHKIKKKKDEMRDKRDKQEDLIEDAKMALDIISNKIDTLKDEVAIENHMSKELLIELDDYVKEFVWIDTSYVDETDLYRDAKEKIKVLSQPLITFDLDIVDILKVQEAFNDWDKLAIGNIIRLKHKDLQVDIDAKITTIEYSMDTNDLKITISNEKYMIDGLLELKDLLDTTSSTSTQIDIGKIKWDEAVKTSTDIDHIIDAKWDEIKDKIEVGTNNSVEIGKRGIIIRDPQNPDTYLVANNGVLAVTNDGGETWKHAITSEGIVGERIYGKLGAFAELRADQIIVGDNGERIPDTVIGSADYWNQMSNLVEDNKDALLDTIDSDILTPKDKLALDREFYQLTGRYLNMIKELDKDSNPYEYKQLVERYEAIQNETTKLLKDMEHSTPYNSRELRKMYKSYYDIEQKATSIIAKSVNEQMQNAEKDIRTDLEKLIDTTIDPLSDYVDGKMTMWFGKNAPTLSNYPAKDWLRDEYESHLGDLYYDELWGNAYRFSSKNGLYSWEEVGDNSIISVLYKANRAKDTADGKRRVFTSTPYPPYDEGDLWVQGASGDLMVCQSNKTSGAYSISDWKRAAKYTDDKKALEAIERAQSSLNKIRDMSSDSTITPDEKIILRREWDEIYANYSRNSNKLRQINKPHDEYRKAYNQLKEMVLPILGSSGTYYSLDRSLFNATFSNYYVQETYVINIIYEEIERASERFTRTHVREIKGEMEENIKGLSDIIDKSSSDNYITKKEANMLKIELDKVIASTNEILQLADDVGLNGRPAYSNLYNSVFGSFRLEQTINKYISTKDNPKTYPIYISDYEINVLRRDLTNVEKYKEQLSSLISKTMQEESISIADVKINRFSDDMNSLSNTLKSVTKDNYITKSEAEMLKIQLEKAMSSAMELINIAKELGLTGKPSYSRLFNELFGKDKLKDTVNIYIDRSNYPVMVSLTHLRNLKTYFANVEKYKEQLSSLISKTMQEESISIADVKINRFSDDMNSLSNTLKSVTKDNYITKSEAEMLKIQLEKAMSSAMELINIAKELGLTGKPSYSRLFNELFGKDKLKDTVNIYIDRSNYPVMVSLTHLRNLKTYFANVEKYKEQLNNDISNQLQYNTINVTDSKISALNRSIDDLSNTVSEVTGDFLITRTEAATLEAQLQSFLVNVDNILARARRLGIDTHPTAIVQMSYTQVQDKVYGKDGIKEILERYIGKSSYPIEVRKSDYGLIQEQIRKFNSAKVSLVNAIERMERDEFLKNDVYRVAKNTVDMNPELIRTTRKYSDVQITKEKGLVASHMNGEYTQLNGSGLVRYVPHPRFEYEYTGRSAVWTSSGGANFPDTIYVSGRNASVYVTQPRSKVVIEIANKSYHTVSVSIDNKTVAYYNGSTSTVETEGFDSDKWLPHPKEYYSRNSVTRYLSRGWHEIEFYGSTSSNYADIYFDRIAYDDDVMKKKLVGWTNTGYKYGYRVHIGEAVSNASAPKIKIPIQLPMDFVMDNASYGQGFDVFLAMKSYPRSGTGYIIPTLRVTKKNETLGTFEVEAYIDTAKYTEEYKKVIPLHFTYFAVSKK